jgi:hypothetical protein
MLEAAIFPPAVRLHGPIADYYRFPAGLLPRFEAAAGLKEANGFFRFGEGLVCYGRTSGNVAKRPNGINGLFNAAACVRADKQTIRLPFNIGEALDNLRYESYVQDSSKARLIERSWVKAAYYGLRPMLPVSIRSALQRIYLRDWSAIRFPGWPLDRSVDVLCERMLALAMRTRQVDRIPFIWFWPEGYNACAVVTHDVETTAGRDFCSALIDVDDAFDIKSSFQIVPEKRYSVPATYLEEIRARGCEVNVQGLDHDGNLFQNHASFTESAKRINEYAELFQSRGFRSPVLYRNANWLQQLNFSYDMSVPNVGRLEAQRGGCCTVMPYSLPGGMTELPVTTTEDYTLFHILNDYSTTLWKQQMAMIMEGHGLISFIVHPDYVMESRALGVYKNLLEELNRFRADHKVWLTLPGEVDRWWRDRSEMSLVPEGRQWKVEGPGSNRARVAFARLDGDRVVYELDSRGN